MSFFIRYDWSSIEDGIDIRDFWESLIGFQEFSKEILKAGKISTDIDIKVTSVRKGSIIVDIAFCTKEIHELFWSLQEFLYFLQIVAPEYYAQIQEQLMTIGNDAVHTWENLETFARQNPIAWWLIWAGIYDLIKIGFRAIGEFQVKTKSIESLPDTELVNIGKGKNVPAGFLKQTKKMVESWKGIAFLEPIIDEKIQNIQIGDTDDHEEVNEQNLWFFIGEWQEILPDLKNGSVKIFQWSFTGMQSNHGETMTFKSSEFKDKRNNYFLFSCLLPPQKKTEDFKDFYGESKHLKLTSEIYRSSPYKKPKLILQDVEIEQTSLGL